MSQQVTIQARYIPTSVITDFGNGFLAITDNVGVPRKLPTFTTPEGDKEVVLDLKPNESWLRPWATTHNIILQYPA
jgi:hypothetical protein